MLAVPCPGGVVRQLSVAVKQVDVLWVEEKLRFLALAKEHDGVNQGKPGATIKIDEMTGRILMRPWNHCNFYHFTEVDLHFNISSGKLEGRQPDLTLNTLADAPVRRRPAIAVLAETFVEMPNCPRQPTTDFGYY